MQIKNQHKYRFTLILLLFIIVMGCGEKGDLVIGVKMYKLPSTPANTIELWKTNGINTAFVSAEVASNKEFRDLAKKENIPVFLISPTFYNPEALKADSTLWAIKSNGEIAKDSWVEFACPSNKEYRNNAVNKVVELTNELKPDGLSIDFIRHFVFWEMVQPNHPAEKLPRTCYCKNCLNEFKKFVNTEYPVSLQNTSDYVNWIDSNYYKEWIQWREELIISIVNEIAGAVGKDHPEIKFNLHAVPWRKHDYNNAISRVAGQNLPVLSKHVDYISPMCYTHMLGRSSDWIDSLITDYSNQGISNILPSIQVSKSYLDTELSTEEFGACIERAIGLGSKGIVFWSWEKLAADVEKQKCLQDKLKKYNK